ncbi:MAG: ABC transporter substrate-binding protein [Magnetococcales bacterium]|nr:ABC transporter substrate-binding protein [Magnetococcales bacterium]
MKINSLNRSGRMLTWGAVWLLLLIPLDAMAADVKAAPAEKLVHICGDILLAPFAYAKRVNGKPTQEITGYTVDLVKALFKARGYRVQVDLLPWVRCQTWVQEGTHYQVALEATYSKERAETYLLSNPYYPGLVGHYYYSKTLHPEGLKVKKRADLRNYYACGRHGSNYEPFGLPNPVIDRHTKTYSGLIKRVMTGRCDLFVAYPELLNGFGRVVNPEILNVEGLALERVPEMGRTAFVMLITRNPKTGGPELKKIIDHGIEKLHESAFFNKLEEKYHLTRTSPLPPE